jgi:hypothetical protein
VFPQTRPNLIVSVDCREFHIPYSSLAQSFFFDGVASRRRTLVMAVSLIGGRRAGAAGALSVKHANMIAASAKPIHRVVCASSMWDRQKGEPRVTGPGLADSLKRPFWGGKGPNRPSGTRRFDRDADGIDDRAEGAVAGAGIGAANRRR